MENRAIMRNKARETWVITGFKRKVDPGATFGVNPDARYAPNRSGICDVEGAEPQQHVAPSDPDIKLSRRLPPDEARNAAGLLRVVGPQLRSSCATADC